VGRTPLTSLLAVSEVDRRLAGHAIAGDEEAFTALFHSYRQDVYRAARAITGSHEAALDTVQQTFFKVHQGLPRWRGDASLRTWIVSIAVRSAIDLRRQSRRSREVGDTVAEPSHDPRPEMERTILLAHLQDLADRLDGQQGLILRLRLSGGLSNKEIAEHLGLSEPNTRMQLSKAVRRLREML
jgi:RNA polymerase sigma-70 factor, ECF subfamily